MNLKNMAATAAKTLKSDVGETLKFMRDTIAWATHASCDARLAAEIVFVVESVDREKDAETGGFVLTPEETLQAKLSEATGVSRPYISTIMAEWEKKNLIRSFGRTVHVLDVEALNDIATTHKGDSRREAKPEPKAPKAKPAAKKAKKKAKK